MDSSPPTGASAGSPEFLSGGGEMGARIRAHDWAATALGPPEQWPQALRFALTVCLHSTFPTAIYWGPELRLLYNDAWAHVPAERHPWALGRPAREVWADIWDVIGPQFAHVQEKGEGLSFYAQHLPMERNGVVRETYWNYSFTPLRGEDGTLAGVFNQGHEITAQVLHERRREAETARQRRLFQRAPGFITVLHGPDHEFEFVNDAYRRLFGERDYIGRPAREVFPELAGQPMFDLLDRVYRTGERFIARHMPIRIALPDGGRGELFLDYLYEPVIDEDGRVTGIFCEGVDVTDSHRAEQALREKSRALETLNRIASETIGERDLARIVQLVVDAGVELSGARFGAFFYNVVEPSGESYTLYTLSGVDRSAFERFPMPRNTAVFGPTFAGEGVVRSDDITADPRYGSNAPHRGMPEGHLPVRSYLAVPVVSGSGEVIGGLFFGHPDTARFAASHEEMIVGLAAQAGIVIDNHRLLQRVQRDKETLEERVEQRTRELSEANEALRQAQKMEAVGQLTGGIAHDFNNLLAGIAGSLEAIERRLREGDVGSIGRYLEGARTSAERAAALTQRLLAFSRRQTLDPKPTDVDGLVAGLEEMIRRTVGPAIAVEVRRADTPCIARIDGVQLESALLNLSINARDAMPDGGRLTLGVAARSFDAAEAARRDLAAGDYLAIWVRDTGTGIPPETIDRIFDPFFTTKPLGQGTGLGLSMVHGFVRQSGGQVEVESQPGEGTTISLLLPRYHGEAPSAPAAVEIPAAAEGAGETVLVVDDEVIVRMLIVELLEEAGYTVIEAHDGPSALRAVETAGELDLLVTDVGLPGGMNGRQLADAAREARPALGVLFVTGYADMRTVPDDQLGGGMQVMVKPFDSNELLRRVAQMLARRAR